MNKKRESMFQEYVRMKQTLKSNAEELVLMAIDFKTQKIEGEGRCKNRVLINAVDVKGGTYLVTVTGFRTFFYVRAPNFGKGVDQTAVLEMLKEKLGGGYGSVEKIEQVQKESLMHFKGSKDASSDFLKVYLNDHSQCSLLSRMLKQGVIAGGVNFVSESYESNVSFLLRFLVEKDIGGMSWFSIPAEKYKIYKGRRMSLCGSELEVDAKYLTGVLQDDPTSSRIASLRMLSFDIECSSYGKFPTPERDPVITIGLTCAQHDTPNLQRRVVLQLDTCEKILGADVRTFDTEEALLEAFDEFLYAYDPDVLLGYNILSFDLKYLLDRREQFSNLDRPFWGRVYEETVYKQSKLNSKIMGFRETLEYDLFGRMVLDMYLHILREKKLNSYKLNAVAYEFLGEQKEEVHHSIISSLQEGSPSDRKRLASYCLKDAILPLKLCDKLKCVYNYVEMARVTGVPISFLFNRGQQVKVNSQILRRIRDTKLIVPVARGKGDEESSQYQGADVLTPKSAFYNVPIATLDFASLYPSIMIAHNFCYSTLCSQTELRDLTEGVDYSRTPTGNYFVTPKQRKGVLPDILENLLVNRKRVKKELADAKHRLGELREDMEEERSDLENLVAVLDGRQLALKISANSVYGFTGASRGFLPCIEIAASTTSIGREMIFKTKNFIKEEFCKAKGFKSDADVVYGDTDSVMINFGTLNVAEAMHLGRQAADALSALFTKPIKLEFEKVYFPYLLISKKRYAGLLWTRPEAPDRKDCKGVENVRRDSCQLVRKMVDKVLEIILYEKDFPRAVDYVKGKIFDLFNHRIDISELIISKSLSKPLDGDKGYNSNLAHVALARRLCSEKGLQFSIGDRIPFVIVSKTKKAPQYEKSEDPNIAFESNVPLDLQYYLERQIKPPLERIFELVVDTRDLFEGEHTRVAKAQKLGTAGGIGKFFTQKVRQCLGCKVTILKNSTSPVCDKCTFQEQALYAKSALALKAKERAVQRLWSECQRCEQSTLTEVICSNGQCPIFFRRQKARDALEDARKKLSEFAIN